MPSLPFDVSRFDLILSAEGLARLEGRTLVLQYQMWALGIRDRRGVKSVSVPVEELQSVELRRGWTGSTLSIQAANLMALGNVPWNQRGRVELNIARKDQDVAEEFVAAVRALLPEPSPKPVVDEWTVSASPTPRPLAVLSPLLWILLILAAAALLAGLEQFERRAKQRRTDERVHELAADAADVKTIAAAGEPVFAEAAALDEAGRASDDRRPQWLEEGRPSYDGELSPELHGGGPREARMVVVSSHEQATPDAARDEAVSLAVELLQHDVVRHAPFGEAGRWLPESLVRAHAVREDYVEEVERSTDSRHFTMYRAHLLVELSPGVRGVFEPILHRHVVGGRLVLLGCVAGMLVLTIATVAGWLRIDAGTGGRRRGWLTLAALVILAGGAYMLILTARNGIGWRASEAAPDAAASRVTNELAEPNSVAGPNDELGSNDEPGFNR